MKNFFRKSFFMAAAGFFAVCVLASCGSGTESVKELPSSSDHRESMGEQGLKSLKILAIGNSFSDDTMEYVGRIAKAPGVKEIKLGNLYVGSCTLHTHYANAENDLPVYDYRTASDGAWQTVRGYRMRAAIESEEWDYISLQQSSGVSGIPSSYEKLHPLVGYVKTWAWEGARIVWNMTWAYQQDSTHREFYRYGNDQTTMYEKIVETVQSTVLAERDIVKICPTGTGIQNARTSFLGDTLTRDGYHLDLKIGRYVAGLTFFHALTGISVKELPFSPTGVSAKEKLAATEAAENAVKTPFAVTPSPARE